MRTLWRLFIVLWVRQPIHKRLPWTEDDKRELDLFLKSGCGKRFTLKLREAAADASFRSVYARPSDAVSAAGYARGFCDCLGTVLRLAQSFPTLESEYGVADAPSLPGSQPTQKDQDWRGAVGGGGLIGP